MFVVVIIAMVIFIINCNINKIITGINNKLQAAGLFYFNEP